MEGIRTAEKKGRKKERVWFDVLASKKPWYWATVLGCQV